MNPIYRVLMNWLANFEPTTCRVPPQEQDPADKAERLAAAEAKRKRRQERNTRNDIAQAMGKLKQTQ